MNEQLLFSGGSLDDVLRGRSQELDAFVSSVNPEVVLSTPESDLIDRLVDQFEVACPTLDWERRYTPGAKDTQVDVTGDYGRATFGGGPHYVAGTAYALHIPFDGDGDVFLLRPQSWSLNPPRAEVIGQELVMSVVSPSDTLDAEAVRRELDTRYGQIANLLATAKDQIDQYNGALRTHAQASIQKRKEKVLKDRELEAIIAVPVTPRSNRAAALVVEVPRKTPTRQQRTVPPFSPEPAITRDDYEQIVCAIGSFGAAAERFPETFGPMSEEVLREIVLVVLNNQFGPSVGEMFSRKGKTDIAILHNDGPVFIAECKIWTGSKGLAEAIEQLFGYLVWRDARSALVLFVHNKDVTAVIAKAEEGLEAHDRFKRRADDASGHPVFVLHHTGDRDREVEVALVVVPIPRDAVRG